MRPALLALKGTREAGSIQARTAGTVGPSDRLAQEPLSRPNAIAAACQINPSSSVKLMTIWPYPS